MTENGKKFLEQVSKDAALQAELQEAQGAALNALLKDKGLEDAAEKTGTEAMLKVASAHGFKLTDEDLKPAKLEAMSEDELKAVAGGGMAFCGCDGHGTGSHHSWSCNCSWIGGSGAAGYNCACAFGRGNGAGFDD